MTYTITAKGRGGTTTAQTTVYLSNDNGKKCLAYVANSGDDTVSVIDTATNSVIKTIAVNNIPKGILVDKDGARVYVTGDLYNNASSIAIIDTGSNAVIGHMYPEKIATGIAYPVEHPTGNYIYGASLDSYWMAADSMYESVLCVFDTMQKQQVKALRIPGNRQGGIVVHPDGTRLYLSLPDDDKILCLDTAKLHQPLPNDQGTVLLSDEVSATVTATGPAHLALSPSGDRLYASLASGIAVIDTSNNGIVSTIDLGSNIRVFALTISPDGSRLIATSVTDIFAIDTVTHAVVRQAVLKNDEGNCLGMCPDGGHVYETCRLEKSVKAINVDTLAVDATIAVGNSPYAYGRFVGRMAETISGRITIDGTGLAGVTVKIGNDEFSTATVTDASGNFITAIKSGIYTVTPERAGCEFTPASRQVTVEQSVRDCDFTGLLSPPTVTISASPAEIQAGQSTTLTWTSTNAVSASIDNGIGDVSVDGSMSVSPLQTTTYVITVSGSDGTATASTTVTVSSVLTPGIVFSASPTTIQAGQSSTLTWTSTNATSASIDNGIGDVSVNGSVSVSPVVTTTYTITVVGAGGTANASVQVAVGAAPPTLTFSATPEFIPPGGSSTLAWTTNDAVAVSIDNGIGAVDLNGSLTVSPASETTYTLTATGSGGTATASATVTVTTATPPTVTLTANPGSIKSGQQALLSWTSTDATSAEIDNGIGPVPVNGSYSVSPTQETTYTITVSGLGGTATAQTTIYMTSGRKCYAYVPNSSTGTVAVIDTASNTIIKTIPTNKGPIGVALTHDGAHVFVSTIYDTYKLIHSIDTATNTIVYSQNTNDAPMGARLLVLDDTHAHRYLYAASLSAGWDPLNYTSASGIFIYNMAQNGNIGQIKCLLIRGGEQGGMALHPDGTRLYLSKPNENEIICLDTDKLHRPKPPYTTYQYLTDEQIASIPVNSSYSLVISPDGNRLYAEGGDGIVVIDTNSHTVLHTIPSSDHYYSLAIHPDGSVLYAASLSMLEAIDTKTNAVIKTLAINGYSSNMSVHPDGSRLYITSYSPTEMCVVDTVNLKLIATIPLSGYFEAYGDFVGYMSESIGGAVTLDGTGQAGVNVKATNADGSEAASAVTDAAGNYITAVAKGTYTVAPTKTCYSFLPQQREVTIDEQSVSQIDFTATAQAPTVTISAQPSTVHQGQASTITWSSTNATSAVVDDGVNTISSSVDGSHYALISKTTTFTITVTGPGGTATDNVVVTFAITPTVTISASPATILTGGSSTLTWSSTNATSASIDNGIGTVPVNGSTVVTPAATTTYTITVTGLGGAANASVKVSVYSSFNSVSNGVVFDSQSMQYIAGVLVTAVDSAGQTKTTQTDTAGKYTIASLAPGIITISFSKSGYDPYQTTFDMSANSTVFSYVGLHLTNVSATLTGTVTDLASSQPITGVLVTAVDSAGQTKTAQTDAAGKYAIASLVPGNVQVSFAKSGYDAYQQTITIPANTTIDLTTQLHMTLVGATMHGLVKDGQTSLPIVGATVTATYTGGSLTSTSGSDGAYALVGIPLNTPVKITASAVDYRDFVINQTFTQNASLTYNFVLFNVSVLATVNGKITNSKTLLPEAGVKVTHEGSNIAVTTAADGTFVFNNIPFGEQTFYLEKTDFIDEFMTFIIDGTPFAIDLIKPCSDGGQITIGQAVSGVILDSISQRPISGAKVRVPALNLEAVTDANGNYSLSGLLIGSYPVIVLAVNHQSLNFMATVAPSETNKLDIVLVPIAKGLITGKITDAATGEPVADASIEVEGSSFLVDASEGDGTYKMVGVPPGSYKVVVTHADYMQTFVENVEVVDLTPTTINMQLSKRPQTGALEGKILDINTGNPVSGATIEVIGTAISATTDAEGKYRLINVPAGLNSLMVSASGYPQSPRLRALIADQSASSPSTTISDIPIDTTSSTVNEAVTQLIRASEGGDIISRDSRFLLHIFPDTLSADANITLKEVTDGPGITIGSDLPLDPALEITGIKAASVMIAVQIASVNGTDPAPTMDGLASVAMRYSQKDADDFQLDENSAFPYFWNGTYFSALNPRPYELAVDKTNNIVYAVMDFSKTVTGGAVSFAPSVSSSSGSAQGAAPTTASWKEIGLILGKAVINFMSYRPNVKIIDKNELDCVTNANADQKPNPNALPLLFLHGFDPFETITTLGTSPNKEERYKLMLQDLVEATNGVYRPVFVSYNTRAKIAATGGKLAEKLFGEYLNQKARIKGLPADPTNPDSGSFSYLDTFSYSMGGIVARSFRNKSTVNMVHNMVMIASPNHGTINLLNHLSKNNPFFLALINNFKWLNLGGADMLDYDDASAAGREQNPFLYDLNSPVNSRAVSPLGDMTLFAGNVETGFGKWGPYLQALLDSPNDSLVPVASVYCRPSNSPLESKLSLLKVYGKGAKIAEVPPKDFSHDTIGKSGKQIKEFINEIALGLSDWEVERTFNENPLDNSFVKPTKDLGGYAKSKVKVEYNVWDGSEGRTARDYDRVVLVIYHKDGNGKWHISEPNGGENGADVNGNVNQAKVKEIKGNSLTNSIGAHILSANVNFEPTPGENEPGYDPAKYIADTTSLVIPLKPGKMTVPLDPTKAHFRTPNVNE